jgi:hypothetical protein
MPHQSGAVLECCQDTCQIRSGHNAVASRIRSPVRSSEPLTITPSWGRCAGGSVSAARLGQRDGVGVLHAERDVVVDALGKQYGLLAHNADLHMLTQRASEKLPQHAGRSPEGRAELMEGGDSAPAPGSAATRAGSLAAASHQSARRPSACRTHPPHVRLHAWHYCIGMLAPHGIASSQHDAISGGNFSHAPGGHRSAG